MSEEKLVFSRPFLVLGNLTLLAWIFLAFFSTWFYNQIYGWLLLVFTAAAIYMTLRRLGCSSCYYCKSCTSGFGRLAGAYFGSGFTKKESVGNRIGIIAFIYILLAPLPAALVSLSLLQSFALLKIAILVLLLVVSIYSLTTWARKPKKASTPNST